MAKRQIKEFLVGLDNAAEVELKIKEALEEAGCKIMIDDGKENRYVPKSRLDDKIAEIAEANTTISTLQGKMKGLEGAEDTIKDLNKTVSDYKATVKNLQIQSAIDVLALEAKAKDSKDLAKFLDMSKISIAENGEVIGVKDQIDTLVKEKQYLFDIENEQGGQEHQAGLFANFLGTGSPGKPSNSNTFGSKTTNAGDFGKMLAADGQGNQDSKVDSNYFFNK